MKLKIERNENTSIYRTYEIDFNKLLDYIQKSLVLEDHLAEINDFRENMKDKTFEEIQDFLWSWSDYFHDFLDKESQSTLNYSDLIWADTDLVDVISKEVKE